MMFDSYKQCESVIIQMLDINDHETLESITMAINVSQSLRQEKEKIWRLNQSFYKTLWNNDEAVRLGFSKYFKKESKHWASMLSYHAEHCPLLGCRVCIHEANIKAKMVNIYERKKSRVYFKQKKEQIRSHPM